MCALRTHPLLSPPQRWYPERTAPPAPTFLRHWTEQSHTWNKHEKKLNRRKQHINSYQIYVSCATDPWSKEYIAVTLMPFHEEEWWIFLLLPTNAGWLPRAAFFDLGISAKFFFFFIHSHICFSLMEKCWAAILLLKLSAKTIIWSLQYNYSFCRTF